jgi:probable H4MPT-linked C1 transfer pathway protein
MTAIQDCAPRQGTIMPSRVLGLDIGGANLKAAHTDGPARQIPFELWKRPEALPAMLVELSKGWPAFDALAVTMTGELCDCFETRSEGVQAILKGVATAAGNLPVWIWTTKGCFRTLLEAGSCPLSVASANWLAIATYAGRFAPEDSALLIDIGSTTTDIVPISKGHPSPRGLTDAERLRHGELVYTGIRRTALCSLISEGLAAELFATTLDAYLVLDKIDEDENCYVTADGRPASKQAAHARLARMLGADHDTCSQADTLALAREAEESQTRLLRNAIQKVAATLPTPPTTVVTCGSGEFLIGSILEAMNLSGVSLSERPAVSQAAGAFAVAVLASEASLP